MRHLSFLVLESAVELVQLVGRSSNPPAEEGSFNCALNGGVMIPIAGLNHPLNEFDL